MKTPLHLERIPHSIELERCGEGVAEFFYIDQRRLPLKLVRKSTHSWQEVVNAIKTLAVRGAPAIGVAGAAAMVLWACREGMALSEKSSYLRICHSVAREVIAARPTAVNLSWGVHKMLSEAIRLIERDFVPASIADALFVLEQEMEKDDEAANRAIGAHGAALLPKCARILTHCNAGSLATVFYGTALGVIYTAAEHAGIERIYADETRPIGQGARLTAWELGQAGVPVTLICDNMAASLMAQGMIDAVVVGADRIAANGDVANKIGTYGIAVLAQVHKVPFYVAAPASTVDFSMPCGAHIPIEMRSSYEVLPYAIEGVEVMNPAFDITPARFITRIITEQGAFKPEELHSFLSA